MGHVEDLTRRQLVNFKLSRYGTTEVEKIRMFDSLVDLRATEMNLYVMFVYYRTLLSGLA